MDVFDLQAKISLDSSEFKKNLDAAGGYMQSFGGTVEGILGKIGGMLATAFSVEVVKNFVEGAVTEFARFEQLVGGVDTLFGESSGRLQEYADAAFQTAGLSANEYMDTATSFAASLIQSLGGDTAAAVDMVDLAVTDMADNANKMGTDIGSIQNAYQGFAKQNYTMLDNLKLGYGGTKSEMARLINDTGILGDTIVEVSTMTKQGNFEEVVSFATVVDAIHAVQENMGITGTTAQEAAQTIEGSVNTMKAAWSNWKVGLGDENADLSGLTDDLLNSVRTAADNIIPVVGQIKESLMQVFTDLTGIDLSPVTAAFDGLKTALSDIGAAFAEGGVSGVLESLAETFERLTGIDLSGLASGIGEFLGEFGTVGSGVLTSVQNAVSAIVEAFSGVNVAGAIELAADALGLFLGAVSEIAGSAISFLAEVVAQLARDFNTWAPGVAAVAAGIGTFMGYLGLVHIIQNASAAITTLKTGFAALSAVMAANPIALVISLIAGLAAAFVTAYNTNENFRLGVQQTWESVKDGAAKVFEKTREILQGIGDVFAEVGAILADIPGDLKKSIGEIGDAISEMAQAVKAKAQEFIQAGKDLVQGFINGITEKLASAKEAISSAFGAVTDWVMGVFDVHSPSRVFADIGRNLMRGLADGVDDESGIVQDSIDRLRLTVPPITTGSVDFAHSAIGKASAATISGMFSSASQSGGTYNINLNVDGRTVAQVVFDPLNNIVKQKGVTLGA